MKPDTIYALATPPGTSAVAVVRVSGPASHQVLASISEGRPPSAWRIGRRQLRDPETGDALDDAMVARFAAPRSYTGEDAVELYLHGGRAIIAAVFEALERQGCRAAAPGEFTRRAFLNGKLDLGQAEAVAEVISAETDARRKHALSLLDGALGRLGARWRQELTRALSILESTIDFTDEDLGTGWIDQALTAVEDLQAEVAESLENASGSEELFEPQRWVLIGPPNAGKSSLLNALSGRDAAIVTETPGTTRDVLRQRLTIDGAVIELVDTAGLRETDDLIEREGVRRAQRERDAAHVVALVLSADTWDADWLREVGAGQVDLIIWTKSDLAEPTEDQKHALADSDLHIVSALDGSAANTLRNVISEKRRVDAAAISPLAGSERRKAVAARAASALGAASRAIKADRIEVAVEELRLASDALSDLVGRIEIEDILDDLFSKFCIGK